MAGLSRVCEILSLSSEEAKVQKVESVNYLPNGNIVFCVIPFKLTANRHQTESKRP